MHALDIVILVIRKHVTMMEEFLHLVETLMIRHVIKNVILKHNIYPTISVYHEMIIRNAMNGLLIPLPVNI